MLKQMIVALVCALLSASSELYSRPVPFCVCADLTAADRQSQQKKSISQMSL
jgi:hypothetical protein